MDLERPALLAQLQPMTPWRCGSGRREESAALVSSATLFAALSNAMARLGFEEEWKREGAASLRLGSLFPMQADVFYAPLPESLRMAAGLRRLRLESVRFAPLAAIASLASRRFDESRWVLDLASGCLLASDRGGSGGPFRMLERARAAVDRFNGSATPAAVSEGLDFGAHGMVWSLQTFENEAWIPRVQAAYRFLADDGIGGWRAAGWGRSRRCRFRQGNLQWILDHMGWQGAADGGARAWWTLGLFNPSETDAVQWDNGAYRTILCSGWSAGAPTPVQRFVREGSILAADSEPVGRMAPSGRFGAGLTLPWQGEA